MQPTEAALEALSIRVEAADRFELPSCESPTDLESAIIEVGELVKMEIPPKTYYLRPWLTNPSIVLISGY